MVCPDEFNIPISPFRTLVTGAVLLFGSFPIPAREISKVKESKSCLGDCVVVGVGVGVNSGRGVGVAVGVEVGIGVAVGSWGTGVFVCLGVGVAVGRGVAVGGGHSLVHASSACCST